MDIIFQRGDPERPSGHALIFFTTGSPERCLATYLIVPPVAFNLTKYLPPMFAGSLGASGSELSRPVPLPPVPEEVPGRSYLERLAEVRNDDLIFAGNVLDDDVQRLMLETAYAAEAYAERYKSLTAALVEAEAVITSEIDAAAMVYSVMGEGQRLGELTKLTGTLREATERRDLRGASEALGDMRSLVETLSPKYRGNHLIAAAQEPDERGRRLCELLLQRAYALHREEYLEVGRLDRDIEALDQMSSG
jgi:hypothetical protein